MVSIVVKDQILANHRVEEPRGKVPEAAKLPGIETAKLTRKGILDITPARATILFFVLG